MPAGPPERLDSDLELGELIEREGRETLIPSLTRSALGRKSAVMEARLPTPMPTPAPSGEEPITLDRRGPKTGDVIGERYIVDGQLGRGGMGRVVRVRHQALGKPFALKLIKSAIATNPKIREMFYREARLASSLTHENICAIFDFGQDETFGLFMVMEMLDGSTVYQKLRQSGRLAPKVACDIMWQVADAVRFIHSRQILHGDIKTENIFMVRTSTGRRLVKLLDFGLARPDLGRSDGVDGTLAYLAPERLERAPASQASDIYALGIVFFELLTGSVPFEGTTQEILHQHKHVPLPPPSAIIDDPLDSRADALIARATAKHPADRHPDVASFLYELRALMGMLGMDRRRPLQSEGARDRRDLDHRAKAAAEVFHAVPLPMACVDTAGHVRVANQAFLEFLGVAGNAGGLELRDSALPEVYPSLFEDLVEVVASRRPIKRVLYLNEGGDRVIEAAIVLTAAPSNAEVTGGEVHLVVHPLRALTS